MGFHIEKERLLANLETLRKRLCCYTGPPCDCKFGNSGSPLGSSEVTGCPELYQAMDIIRGEDAAAKEKAAYERGVAAERERCRKLVDPDTTPAAFSDRNAVTCLAAVALWVDRGLEADALRVRPNGVRLAEIATRRKRRRKAGA